MESSKVFNITFAGGSCGITMVRVGEKLTELCQAENLFVKIKYIDLWVSDYLLPSTDLVVEMFPYYKNLDMPLVNGRPFLNPMKENDLYVDLIDRIKEIISQN
jgi:hypothetical protein